MENAKDIAALISTVGFPAFVACWFMLRIEKLHLANINAINELAKAVVALREHLVKS